MEIRMLIGSALFSLLAAGVASFTSSGSSATPAPVVQTSVMETAEYNGAAGDGQCIEGAAPQQPPPLSTFEQPVSYRAQRPVITHAVVRHDSHVQRHLASASRLLDQALSGHRPLPLVNQAEQELHLAIEEVHGGGAARLLKSADEHLGHYRQSHDHHELLEANRLLRQAMRLVW